jgi:hypothetical protein
LDFCVRNGYIQPFARLPARLLSVRPAKQARKRSCAAAAFEGMLGLILTRASAGDPTPCSSIPFGAKNKKPSAYDDQDHLDGKCRWSGNYPMQLESPVKQDVIDDSQSADGHQSSVDQRIVSSIHVCRGEREKVGVKLQGQTWLV